MDRKTVQMMRAYLEVALTGFQEHFGVDVKVGTIRFAENNATVGLEISTVNDDGEVVTKESEDFRRYAHEYGLKPEWLGKTFESRGQEFTRVGLSTRAKKYKVIARNSEGVGYKFHHDSVIAKMIGL
jgi:hypothetical protein